MPSLHSCNLLNLLYLVGADGPKLGIKFQKGHVLQVRDRKSGKIFQITREMASSPFQERLIPVS